MYKIQLNCPITFNSLKLNWFSFLKECSIFDKIWFKKAIGKKHALALPRRNVTLGKMLLGKLELDKKLPGQNVA